MEEGKKCETVLLSGFIMLILIQKCYHVALTQNPTFLFIIIAKQNLIYLFIGNNSFFIFYFLFTHNTK